MKVREIKLNQFKRFTETTITDIPQSAKLVILVGPNGSGKSSLIDAVHMWHRMRWAQMSNWDETYHHLLA
jgi:chromosome segregation ATPase